MEPLLGRCAPGRTQGSAAPALREGRAVEQTSDPAARVTFIFLPSSQVACITSSKLMD